MSDDRQRLIEDRGRRSSQPYDNIIDAEFEEVHDRATGKPAAPAPKTTSTRVKVGAVLGVGLLIAIGTMHNSGPDHATDAESPDQSAIATNQDAMVPTDNLGAAPILANKDANPPVTAYPAPSLENRVVPISELTCKNVQGAVVDLMRKKNGIDILEFQHAVKADPSPRYSIACDAVAITDRGKFYVSYASTPSDDGQTLVFASLGETPYASAEKLVSMLPDQQNEGN